MRELAKAVQNSSVQKHVRQTLQHVPSFKLDVALPEKILSMLNELDRAEAAREAKKIGI